MVSIPSKVLRVFIGIVVAASFVLEATAVYAQNKQIPAAARPGTKVYAAPNPSSEVLIQLDNMTNILVLSRRGQWARIRVTIERDFFVDGWTASSNLYRIEEPKEPEKPEEPKPDPALETIIGTQKGASQSRQASKPPQEDFDDEPFDLLGKKLDLTALLGYRSNSYAISDTGSSLSLDLPTLVFGVSAQYTPFRLLANRLALGFQFLFEYELRSYTVDLADDSTPPLLISSDSLSGSGINLDFGLLAEYFFNEGINAPSVNMNFGYIIYSSRYSDATVNDTPIDLISGGDYTHLYFGAGGEFPFKISNIHTGIMINGQLLFGSTFTEKNDSGTPNLSGTNPSVGMSYIARIGVFWSILENLRADLYYYRRDLNIDFTGAGQRITGTSQTINFTDASVSDVTNGISVDLRYNF